MSKKNKKKKKGKGLSIFLFIIIILVSFLLFFYIKIERNGGGIRGLIYTIFQGERIDPSELKPIYSVILGTNEDNTDTILLAGYNPKTKEASLLSIPRDTFVGNKVKNGKAKDKINSVYRIAGPEKVLKEISELVGFDVDNYVIVDTEGLVKIVDAIGGVYYDVPIDMNYHDSSQKLSIELKKGYQKLNGKQAEGLVRFRHNDDGSTYPYSYGVEDHGRNKTQRNFIKEMSKQLLQAKNITKINTIANVVRENVKTNLTEDEIRKYVPFLLDLNIEDIKQGIVPGKDVNTTAWFFLPDEKKLKEIIYDLFVFKDDPRKYDFQPLKEEKTEVEKTVDSMIEKKDIKKMGELIKMKKENKLN